jgi:ribosomal protein S6
MTYALTMVLRSDLKDADRKKILDSFKDELKSAKVAESDWGQKPLSYPIKKEVSGHYVHWLIESPEVLPKDLDKNVMTNDGILRHLLLRIK